MKERLIILLIGISVVISSCSKLIQPNNIDNPEILSWVWTNLDDNVRGYRARQRVYQMHKNLEEEFIDKVREREFKAAGFERIGDLENAVINYWLQYSWKIPHSASKIEDKIKNSAENFIWHLETRDTDLYLCKNKYQATELFKSLLWCFYQESGGLVQERFKVLNWDYAKDAQGDGYTGYYIEYEVGDGLYVLLLLIEYDDDSKYEVNVIYSGDSLAEMNASYQ